MDAFQELFGSGHPATREGVGRPESPAAGLVPPAAGGDLAMGGGFDAADTHDQVSGMWFAPLRSADADLLPDKETIDGRTRDMMRNDAFIQGGANLRKDNIVGSQYLLNCRPATRVLFGKEDEAWEEDFQAEVEELFDLGAESPDCWIDAQRTNTFTELVRLAVGVDLAGGEVLAAAEWIRGPRPFATAIQMIEADRLETRPESQTDRSVRAGIRFDSRGAPLAYQIRTEHPNDWTTWGIALPDWREVDVRKPWGRLQIIHIHEQVRPDQTRGISELATSLREQRMGRRFRDVNLQRAIMQSLYAAAITSELPTAEIMARMGGSDITVQGVSSAMQNYATGYLSAVNSYTKSAENIRLDGARIPHFYPGTKLEMLSPTQGQALGLEFEQSLLRYIAASIGVSYEQLSRDYTSTNYSSARAAMTETWKFMQARKKMVADRFASLVFRLWLEEQINQNRLYSFPARKAKMLYTGGVLNLRFDAISRCEWVGASRGQIDEFKETQAAALRIEKGLSTAEDELARLGRDWRKVYRQLKREQRLREVLDLHFVPTDPAVLAAANEANSSDEEKKAA